MTKAIEEYRTFGQRIEALVRPATFPLAVKIVRSQAEIPPEYKRPSRDLGLQNFVCQNFKIARSYGWSMAVTAADTNCKLARAVYGWDVLTDEERKWAEAFSVGLYAQDGPTAGKFEQYLHRLDDPFEGLLIAPLTRCKFEPDTIMVYCLPGQAMRFIQGYLFMEGGVLSFSAAGRVGSCHEGVIKAIKTQQPQYVTLGNGDRIWGGAQDHEVMFACPAEKLPILMEGLERTHAAGLRYPIPQYMNFTPGFQAAFEQAAMDRAGGTIKKPSP